jgi:[methyl-Co(III) methanol-specific corrinoid protein]:coenzyme M methyltransferase
MAALTEKERLLEALSGKRPDRPPVIAPGGMMSFLTSEVMGTHRIDGARAMSEAEAMAEAAVIARDVVGFESLGVPFCLTVEAEAFGAKVSCGTVRIEPMILEPAVGSAGEVLHLAVPDPHHDERMPAVLEAIEILKGRFPEVPMVGNVSGPATLGASIVPDGEYLRLLLKDPCKAAEVTTLATEAIIGFASAMVESGADVLVVSDPTACGEIVGPDSFGKHFLPGLQRIFGGLKTSGAKTVLHICGDVTKILGLVREVGADAFSMDSMVAVSHAREELAGMAIMGNLSTQLLAEGDPDAVARAVERVLSDGVDVVAPSCGLDRSTPLENLRSMCETVKSWDREA